MLFTDFEKHLKVVKGAIHIGANDGAEREWYSKRGISPVLWFEPNPNVFLKLSKNIEGRVDDKCYRIGIHDTLKTAKLHVATNRGLSSSILPFGTHSKYRPDITYMYDKQIRLMRMDDFIKNRNVDITQFNFLNIDVQGVELSVIKSFGDYIGKMDYIYTEVNTEELYVGGCLVNEIDDYLQKYNFIRKETFMTKYNWGDAFYIKKDLL